MTGGSTNYLKNLLIDFLFRAQSTSPAATLYVALATTTPTAAASGAEVTASDYARVAVTSALASWAGTQGDTTTAVSSGTTGKTSNNAIIDFGTASSSWGTITYWEIYDASTAGNRLLYGPITDSSGNASPRSVVSGDPVSFPISALAISFA